MFPVDAVVLPVPLADGAVLEAEGCEVPEPLPVPPVVPPALALVLPVPDMLPLPVLALPLPPGVDSLIVELPPPLVVVVVVVVVWLEALVEPLMPELEADPPFCQSPRTLTALPTSAERSWLLCRFANLPFFSCNM